MMCGETEISFYLISFLFFIFLTTYSLGSFSVVYYTVQAIVHLQYFAVLQSSILGMCFEPYLLPAPFATVQLPIPEHFHTA